MKLMIVIVQSEDAGNCISGLMRAGFQATRLSTTGGFLRKGNDTLMVGVQEEQVDAVMKVIEKTCRSRKQMTSAVPPAGGAEMPSWPMEVTVGGATVFVLNIDQFVKL